MMPEGCLSLVDLEADWKLRLQKAKSTYQSACEHQQRMTEELNEGLVARENGSFAIAQARRAAAWARSEVVRTLDIYVNLAGRGKMPPLDEDDESLLI